MSRHSNDLRQRVIAFYTAGNSKSLTARTFQISRDTLNSWIELEQQGKLLEVKQYHHGKVSGVSLAQLEAYIANTPDKYYIEIAKDFKISKSQAHRLVTRRLMHTSKKNKPSTENQIES